MRNPTRILFALAVMMTPALPGLAQQNAPAPAPKRATLIFRETFKGPQPGRERSTALKATDIDKPTSR